MYNLKKADFILLSFIVLISILLLLIFGRSSISVNKKLEIYVGNELYGSYSLNDDRDIKIGNTNTCEIKEGKVKMTYADCRDHLCEKSGQISDPGQSIICIPNQVSLIITGDEDDSGDGSESSFGESYDAIVK